jgi:hypothetical protein
MAERGKFEGSIATFVDYVPHIGTATREAAAEGAK